MTMTNWANLNLLASELVATVGTNQSERLPSSNSQEYQTCYNAKLRENHYAEGKYKTENDEQQANGLNGAADTSNLALLDLLANDYFCLWT
jgi:hypothetical protein